MHEAGGVVVVVVVVAAAVECGFASESDRRWLGI